MSKETKSKINFEHVCGYALARIDPSNVHEFLEAAVYANRDPETWFEQFEEDYEDFIEWSAKYLGQ